MVLSCCAINCTQRFEKGISFHYFPKDTHIRDKWLVAIRRDKWKPNKRDALCHHHFTTADYNTSGWSSRRTLKCDAVPSIFNFPEHLQTTTKTSPVVPSILNFPEHLQTTTKTSPVVPSILNFPEHLQTTTKTSPAVPSILNFPEHLQTITKTSPAVPSILNFPEHLPATTKTTPVVPSILNFPEHLQTTTKTSPPRKRTASDAELDIVTVVEATLRESMIINESIKSDDNENTGDAIPKKKRMQYFGDFSGKFEDYTSEELKVFFELAKKKVDSDAKKKKFLHQKIRRQAKKIDTLTKLVQLLKKRNLASPEVAAKIMEFRDKVCPEQSKIEPIQVNELNNSHYDAHTKSELHQLEYLVSEEIVLDFSPGPGILKMNKSKHIDEQCT